MPLVQIYIVEHVAPIMQHQYQDGYGKSGYDLKSTRLLVLQREQYLKNGNLDLDIWSAAKPIGYAQAIHPAQSHSVYDLDKVGDGYIALMLLEGRQFYELYIWRC